MADCYLREDLKEALPKNESSADQLLSWGAELANNALAQDVYRNKEGRKTLRFEWQGKSFFLKQHSGIGWGEIFKNLSQGRLPVLGASNEYRAVNALTEIGVDTMTVAAYASKGANPATVQSMIVTDDLVGTVSLEDYCADWNQNPPPFPVRLRILLKLADSSRRMHQAGINHRDFYICHFHLDEATLSSRQPRCCLIDLHRAQMRSHTPRRWLIKDLAGLYFSAMDCGLTQRDLLRFMRHYSDGGLRQALGKDSRLWDQVVHRAKRLYQREHGTRPPPLPK